MCTSTFTIGLGFRVLWISDEDKTLSASKAALFTTGVAKNQGSRLGSLKSRDYSTLGHFRV